ncbi:MAG: MATE family efflux transporter [Erysipelotrichaceae bacterium]|nr:MATE family efflux transporter [Erysipelotrichaceae bacterium]
MAKTKLTSLTEGNIPRLIFSFSWPIFISMIFTELYNITNSLIVGNYVSLEALSAVSACTWLCNMFNYLFYGLGMGAGILIAKYYGAKDEHNLKKTLDTAIIFGIVGGIILTVLSELFLPSLMHICNIGGDIFEDAQAYLRVYFLGNTAVLTYQMCFFILRSFGDTKHQLYYSIISSIINVGLGVLFVRMFHLNVIGTAMATIISQFAMDVLALRLMLTYEEVDFDFRNIEFSFETVFEICKLGIPAGIQNMLIALGSIVVQSRVNEFPNAVIAGIGVGEKIANWAQLFSVSVSNATMALVAQNLGARKYDRVRESIKESMRIATFFTIISITVIWILAPVLVSRFSDNQEAVFYGINMVRHAVFGLFFLNYSHIYNGACRGAGNVRYPMYIAIFGQCICKMLFVTAGLKLFYDVRILYCATAFGHSMAGILATLYFFRSKWVLEHGLREEKNIG